jgi:hypothetical protein
VKECSGLRNAPGCGLNCCLKHDRKLVERISAQCLASKTKEKVNQNIEAWIHSNVLSASSIYFGISKISHVQ